MSHEEWERRIGGPEALSDRNMVVTGLPLIQRRCPLGSVEAFGSGIILVNFQFTEFSIYQNRVVQ